MAEKWRGPIPKPTSTKKKKAKANTGGKTVNMALVEEKRRRINNTNRARGKATEREVAKRMDGIVVPLSGAVKNSVMNLEGDVQIRDLENKDTLFVIECKNSSTLTPKGDRSFTLKRSVVEQAFDEAEIQHAIGILRIHWHALKYDDDIAIVKVGGPYGLEEIVRLARLGKKYEKLIEQGVITDE